MSTTSMCNALSVDDATDVTEVTKATEVTQLLLDDGVEKCKSDRPADDEKRSGGCCNDVMSSLMSFSLSRRQKLALLSICCVELTTHMCIGVMAPFFPGKVFIFHLQSGIRNKRAK